jgi:Protein of unknown function (DUF3037)
VPDLIPYDYAIVRAVPRVDRDEFLNIGVIVSCAARKFLAAGIEIDGPRIQALDPGVDLDTLRAHAASIPAICAGGPGAGAIGRLTERERFHWLVAPRSTMVQVSPVHSGLCADPQEALEHLLASMVRLPGGAPLDEIRHRPR